MKTSPLFRRVCFLSCLLRLLQSFDQNTVSSSAVFVKVRIEYGKKGIVAFSGNGKEPHVSRSVIGPFLLVLLAEARARLLFCAKGSMSNRDSWMKSRKLFTPPDNSAVLLPY